MGKKMPMSATESNNTCTISSSLIHIKTKKREKKTEKFFYHLQIKTSKDYAEYMASIGRLYCTQCTHKELQGIIYPYLSVSYIYFTHTLHLHTISALCNIYFYVLNSHAAWNMHHSVVHSKCRASVEEHKKRMNYRGERWPAENLTLRNDWDGSVRLLHFPQKWR